MDGTDAKNSPCDHTVACQVACAKSGYGLMMKEGAAYRFVPFTGKNWPLPCSRKPLEGRARGGDRDLKDGSLMVSGMREVEHVTCRAPGAGPACLGGSGSAPGRLDHGDVDLAHFHHRLERALGGRPVGIGGRVDQVRSADPPGHAPSSSTTRTRSRRRASRSSSGPSRSGCRAPDASQGLKAARRSGRGSARQVP